MSISSPERMFDASSPLVVRFISASMKLRRSKTFFMLSNMLYNTVEEDLSISFFNTFKVFFLVS